MFTFGFTQDPPGAVTLGARAIDDGDRMGLLFDRQTWFFGSTPLTSSEEPTPEQRAAIKALAGPFNRILEERMQPAFLEARGRGELRREEPGEVVLYEDWFVRAVANTNGSHGYVYLSVGLKPLPDIPVLFDLPEEDDLMKQGDPGGSLPDDYVVWSNDRRPAIGERVWCTQYGCPVTVVGYAREYAYLYMLAIPDTWPDWMLESVDRGHRTLPFYTNLMGREWLELDPETNTPIKED